MTFFRKYDFISILVENTRGNNIVKNVSTPQTMYGIENKSVAPVYYYQLLSRNTAIQHGISSFLYRNGALQYRNAPALYSLRAFLYCLRAFLYRIIVYLYWNASILCGISPFRHRNDPFLLEFLHSDNGTLQSDMGMVHSHVGLLSNYQGMQQSDIVISRNYQVPGKSRIIFS